MKHIIKIISGLTVYCFLTLNAQVLIITHSYNRPDFIEIQHKTFKKFMLDDYEFVVFNDARDHNIREQIRQVCSKYALRCIDIPQEIHDRPYLQRQSNDNYNDYSARAANVIQYSLDVEGFDHNGMVMIIDSDMFLVEKFSVTHYLGTYDLAGLPQNRKNEHQTIDYIWNGLLFFNMSTLPDKRALNFNCGWVEGVLTDTGGYTYYYFQKNPHVRFKSIDGLLYLKDFWCKECFDNIQTTICQHNREKMYNFSDPLIDLAIQDKHSIMEIFLGNTFLHYRAGGNWNNQAPQYHQKKTALLKDFIDKLLRPNFFLTGELADLIPLSQRSVKNPGTITVLTQQIHPESSSNIQGHSGVTSSVLRGLKKLGIPMNYNPHTIEEVGDHIFVLVDIPALQQAIELKRLGRIKTLIAGPNILSNPNEYDHILGFPEIDWYIAPCNWARECNCEQEPGIQGKTAIWHAGVDTEYWHPKQEKPQTKTMLVYWKTEPESFCVEIESLLHENGWKTKRLQYGTYAQEQYKQLLQEVDAAIFISVSESQGIALAECWAMNVPTLVWNPGSAFIYNRWLPVSSAPYITNKTGLLWQTINDLDLILKNFNSLKEQFNPREWVINYMTDSSSIHLLLDLINYTLDKKNYE